jgi:hypothetical protein
MRSRRAVFIGSTVMAVVGGLVGASDVLAGTTPAGTSAERPAGGVPAVPEFARSGRSVTLGSGDRVTVDGLGTGSERVQVRPADGRRGAVFLSRRMHGRHVVIPADALGPVRAGRVAPEQFDLTGLLGGASPVPASGGAAGEAVDLRIVHVDRAGRPASRYATSLIDLDSGATFDAGDPDGTSDLRVPAGRYTVAALIYEPDPDAPDDPDRATVSTLYQPELHLNASRQITVDARRAGPVKVTVPRSSARAMHAEISYTVRPKGVDVPSGFNVIRATFDRVYAGRLDAGVSGGRVDGISMRVVSQWADPGPNGDFAASPYVYSLAWGRVGGVFDRYAWRVADRDLAAVVAEHNATPSTTTGAKYFDDHLPGIFPTERWTVPWTFPLPFTGTEYYNTDGGVEWSTSMAAQGPAQPGGEPVWALFTSPSARYVAGRRYKQVWNRPVFGPDLVGGPGNGLVHPFRWINPDTGEHEMLVYPSLLGDRAGRQGNGNGTSRITLFRDGKLVATSDIPGFGLFTVPPEPAPYRLETELTDRTGVDFSRTVRVEWTFQSGPTGTGQVPLPLSVVRFTPSLSAQGAAPAGRAFAVPVSVQAQAGSTAAPNRALTVQVSFDDGQSWRSVAVRDGHVVVKHPSGNGFVSLRATATDQAGNTVDQTVIRAYAYG